MERDVKEMAEGGEAGETATVTAEGTPREADAIGEAAAGEGGEETAGPSGDEVGGDASAEEAGGGPSVQRAEFEKLTPREGVTPGDNIDLLLDVTVPVTVELGTTEMFIKDVLAVGPGSVIRLDRALGKPLDILVNGELVGRGDVVVVDEQFGVRVTELMKPAAKRK
ncbi:MAG: flagellar motor switch protein FliN [Candidatus Eisenbacteria bacterium]